MKFKLWLSVAMIAVMLMSLVGCKKAGNDEGAEVKSQAEYKVEADEEITEENMEDELGRIEDEMTAENEE